MKNISKQQIKLLCESLGYNDAGFFVSHTILDWMEAVWEKNYMGETCTGVSDPLNELAVHHTMIVFG